jgi:hypothetical protein
MRLRVASWNIRGAAHPALQLALLARCRPDIVLLQDVSQSAAQAIRTSGCLGTAIDTWSGPDAEPGTRPRIGCLMTAPHGWRLSRDDQPGVTGRLLCGTATYERTQLTLFSCYAPTNTGPLRAQRPAFFTALAQQLDGAPTPLILGMDANGPRVDHPDLDRSVWWTPEEQAVLDAGTPTSDALRLWYADHPADFRRRVRYYPRGPLADSFHRGRRGKYVRSRYDSIRVSPGIRVLDVRYLYDDAVQAGSDHALVVTDVELP